MNIHLTKKDFKIEWFSGTGAGGQYRNKHQNCCRITHLKTGIQAIATDRERISNQRNAFQALAKRLLAHFKKIESETGYNINTGVIRNYNESRNEVHDKASGLKLSYKSIVTGNNISPMITARASSM